MGKLTDDILRWTIDINGKPAMKELGELERSTRKLESTNKGLRIELQKMEAAGKKNTKEYKDLQAQIKKNNTTITSNKSKMAALRKELGVNSLTARQLRSEYKRLKNQMDNLTPGTKEWKKLNKEMGAVKTRMNQVRGAGGRMNKMFGSLKMLLPVLGIGALVAGFKKLITVANDFNESVANLSALTGLSGKELKYLSDRAKDFAGSVTEDGIRITKSALSIVDAYTQMGSKRPELLKDKEALASVTEQAIILAQAAKMELVPATNSLAISMNQFNAEADEAPRYINAIAAGSKEGAGDVLYIAAALEKSGTAMKLAGINIEEGIGLIETLAPKFSEATMAGTQLKNVMIKLQMGADKFNPEIVGMETALDNLAGANLSVTKLTKLFGLENLNAAQTLIGGRKEFVRYRDAVTDTNVAIEQAIKNTSTDKAKLEARRQELNKYVILLGEKLAPALTYATGAFVELVKGIIIAIKFFYDYKGVIITLTTAIVAYTIATKIQAKWDSIHYGFLVAKTVATKAYGIITGIVTGKIKLATIAQRAFNLAMKSNPIGLLITLLASAGIAYFIFRKKVKDTNKALEEQKRIQEEYGIIGKNIGTAYAKQKSELDKYYKALLDTNKPLSERNILFKEFVDKYGSYLKNLGIEVTKIGDLKDAYDKLNESILTTIVYKYQKQETEELVGKYASILAEFNKFNEDVAKGVIEWNTFTHNEFKNELLAIEVEIDKLPAKYKTIALQIQEGLKNIDLSVLSPDDDAPTPPVPLTTKQIADYYAAVKLEVIKGEKEVRELTEDELKKLTKAREKAAEELKKQLEAEEKYRQDTIDGAKSLIEQEEIAYDERLKKAGLFGKKKEDMTKQELDALEVLEKNHIKNIDDIEDKAISDDIKKQQELFDQITIQRKTDYNNQLAALGNNEEAKKQLKEEFEQKELERQQLFLKKLTDQLKSSIESGEWDGINIEDAMLSDEQKESLLEKLATVELALAELRAKASGGSGEEEEQEAFDIFGMSSDDWIMFLENLADGKLKVDDIQFAVNALMDVWQSFHEIRTNNEQKELQQFESNSRAKKKLLAKQLKDGIIDQEKYNAEIALLDDSLDKKQIEIANKRAKREKEMALIGAITNTSLAIVKALGTQPVWVGIALAAIIAALGGIQIAKIASTPVPQYELGNYLDVIGASDKKKYRAKKAEGTGLYDQPTLIPGLGLVAEKQPEIVFSGPDTQKILNTPGLIDAINYTLRAPQFAAGQTQTIEKHTTETIREPFLSDDMVDAMNRFSDTMELLQNEGIKGKWVWDEFEEMKNNHEEIEESVNMRD